MGVDYVLQFFELQSFKAATTPSGVFKMPLFWRFNEVPLKHMHMLLQVLPPRGLQQFERSQSVSLPC